MMLRVPDPIYGIIQSFLSQNDYHYLMNSSKELFFEIKRLTIYFSLTAERSMCYLTNEAFRNQIKSLVKSCREQVSLKLGRGDDFLPTEVLLEHPVEKVDVRNVDDRTFQHLAKIRTINCWISTIKHPISFNEIKNILFVTWPSCLTQELTVSKLERLTINNLINFHDDVSIFSNIPYLELNSCYNIKDFSSLGPKQKRLFLSGAKYLTDVKSFATVKHLTLLDCQSVEDISLLKNVYHLEIMMCDQIKVMWKEKDHSVHRIHLDFIKSNIDPNIVVEALNGIAHVRVEFPRITDVSMLAEAKSVLVICSEVLDVSPLRNAKKLILSQASKIKDFGMLGEVRNLTITNANKSCFYPVGNNTHSRFRSISLVKCDLSDSSLSFLCDYHSITLSSINVVPLLDCLDFRNVQEFTIRRCEDLITLTGLANVRKVTIQDCYSLVDISNLGRGNHTVAISDCLSIRDVSSLSQVPVVKIANCRGIEDYSCLKSVPRLTIFIGSERVFL
eukprot:gene2100-2239_t